MLLGYQKMKRKLCAGLTIAALMLYISNAQAGFVIGGTRILFPSTEKEADITVHNTDKNSPYLVQSWVDTPSGKGSVPFIATPPLFRLDAQQQNMLRIVKTSTDFPTDRESVFWLNIKAIPPVNEKFKNTNILQFSIRSRLKLFYRPEGLPGSPGKAVADLQWGQVDGKLIAHNDSPYFISLASTWVNGKKIFLDYTNNTIPPKGEASFSTKLVVSSKSKIEWDAISAYGPLSKAYTATVQ